VALDVDLVFLSIVVLTESSLAAPEVVDVRTLAVTAALDSFVAGSCCGVEEVATTVALLPDCVANSVSMACKLDGASCVTVLCVAGISPELAWTVDG
jgi:hypothetical protein